GRALYELDGDAHGDEARRVSDASPRVAVELAEPEHQAAVGDEMADLVALLEDDVRRLRRERKPEDRRHQSPADRDGKAPQVQSILMFDVRTTCAHLSSWVASQRSVSAGGVAAISPPSPAMRSRTSGAASAFANSVCSRCTIAAGAPAGAKTAFHSYTS